MAGDLHEIFISILYWSGRIQLHRNFGSGYTHWSMTLLGGLCLMVLCHISRRFPSWRIGAQALLGAAVITAAELCVGIVVNHILGWNVWDYYAYPLNLWGKFVRCLVFTGFCCVCPSFFTSLSAKIPSGRPGFYAYANRHTIIKTPAVSSQLTKLRRNSGRFILQGFISPY